MRQEIVALTEIPHVGGSSARLLFNHGLRTVEAVAGASSHYVIADILSAGELLPCLPCTVTDGVYTRLCNSTCLAAHAGSTKSSQKQQHQLSMRALKIWRSARDFLKQRRLVRAVFT